MQHPASSPMQRKKKIPKRDDENFIESQVKDKVTEEEDQDDEYFAIESLTSAPIPLKMEQSVDP